MPNECDGDGAVIRDIVQQQMQETIRELLAIANPKRKAKNGRRRRRGPGRPPRSKTRTRRA
jgi:hypothetical protein